MVGVHTPETSEEKVVENVVEDAVKTGMDYPLAADQEGATWTSWANNMWPAVYIIDKRGYIRYWWYGELNWQGAKGEEYLRGKIDELLAESD